MVSIIFFPDSFISKMSVIHISPLPQTLSQTSKVIALERRSTESDATVIHMRLKKSHARKSSFYTQYSSKAMPYYAAAADEPCIINIIHESGGAKAPWLIHEGVNATLSP
jgi:hypothetical protein